MFGAVDVGDLSSWSPAQQAWMLMMTWQAAALELLCDEHRCSIMEAGRSCGLKTWRKGALSGTLANSAISSARVACGRAQQKVFQG
jgi:hypothetical protein